MACAADPWLDVDVHGPIASGGHSAGTASLVITGSGQGDDANFDRLHYVYQQMPAGDVEVIARLTSLAQPAKTGRTGIMLRGGVGAGAARAIIGFCLEPAGTRATYVRYSDQAAMKPEAASGYTTAMAMPIWL